MILIKDSIIRPTLQEEGTVDFQKKKLILDKLYESQEVFVYNSIDELKFELALRYHMTNGCEKMYECGMQFRDFHTSFCNPIYWERTMNGGFRLRYGRRASEALNDIFKNGHLYGTECATAIMIVIYYALLQVLGDEKFDQLYPNLLLFTWNYDSTLRLKTRHQQYHSPGDIVYFKNPQVHPMALHWQGENTIVLLNNLFYGHGAGVVDEMQIILKLNINRIPGAHISAYKTNHNTQVDSVYMFQFMDASKLTDEVVYSKLHERDFTLVSIGSQHEVIF